jgi:hypothetical protein
LFSALFLTIELYADFGIKFCGQKSPKNKKCIIGIPTLQKIKNVEK